MIIHRSDFLYRIVISSLLHITLDSTYATHGPYLNKNSSSVRAAVVLVVKSWVKMMRKFPNERMYLNGQLCLTCHKMGNQYIKQPKYWLYPIAALTKFKQQKSEHLGHP